MATGTTRAAQPAPTVQIHTRGPVSEGDVDYARHKVEAVLQYARDPVLFARAKITLMPDPAVPRPAVAQVNLDVNGRLVRAQCARATMREALDEVHDRLRERVQRAAGDWEAIRGGKPVTPKEAAAQPHEWRHTSAPTERPPYYPRSAEERQVLRHKTFALGRMTIDEAAFDMDMLGYTFHLFTEEGSGQDSVIYRTTDGGMLRMSQLSPHPAEVTPGAAFVTVSTAHPPTLETEQAVAELGVTGWPFVFFRDPASGRGRVLYHRYDGHYGLITPAE